MTAGGEHAGPPRRTASSSAANTDYAAAVESLKAHLAEQRRATARSTQLSQLSVLILGAGGVARAIAYALHREGAQLTITGRTYERAQRLAEEVKCKAVDWHARHSVYVRRAHQLHPGRHAPERGRVPVPLQHPEARHDRVRHDLHARRRRC